MTDETAKGTQNLAAIAAIGRGDLSQIRILYEGINKRLTDVEEKGKSDSGPEWKHTHALSGVEPVDLPPGDARSPEIREYLTTLSERFNALLEALKG